MAHVLSARRAVAAVILVALSVLPFAGIASAHASLVRANISPGQVFTQKTYPRLVTAFFAENVNPKGSFIHVFEGDPKGDHGAVDLENVRFPFKNPKEITVGLPSKLSKGPYILMWYTVSADDGHIAGDSYTFTIR
ncbi:MAG TPA: copper resistance protein CopC [Chloroflexota bacterium]|nr:copper resistance protein CopC [Chloroflexota bacterium]